MPRKSDHDFREKYLFVPAGTLEPKNLFFAVSPALQNTSKAHNDKKFGKEVKTIIPVGISLNSSNYIY